MKILGVFEETAWFYIVPKGETVRWLTCTEHCTGTTLKSGKTEVKW